MIVVRSLGSGSSGNALLVDTGDCLLVVDCGIGPRALAQGLRAAGRRFEDLDGVLLTHEHTDHVRSLPTIVARRVPVLATPGTARATRLPITGWQPVRPHATLKLGATEVTPLPVSHDAAEPCGYYLRSHSEAVTILTDLGTAHESLHDYLAASDLIVLEANHDEDMLRYGPYPAHLKRRVLSPTGHLSNAACGSLLVAALPTDGRSRTIWLAHLSTTNNRPELARAAVQAALAKREDQAEVLALPRYGQDIVWRSGPAAPAQLGLEFSVFG